VSSEDSDRKYEGCGSCGSVSQFSLFLFLSLPAFLVLLCVTICFFGYNVFLNPHEWQPLHYLNVTILLVTGTMLFLFFASGMYAERIAAANK
jgi:hypothetical protein